MLDAIARRGKRGPRDAALDSMAIDASFRAARTGFSESLRAARRKRRALRRASVGARPLRRALATKTRTIFDANNLTRLPGELVRREDQGPTGDVAVDEAYDYLGATWDLYFEEYGRNSLDDAGMSLNATVHFSRDYDNAFWDGRQMVFGDGDGEIFERFTKAIDVVGHELTHGVIEHEAGLVYFGQPGALNESLADVFGSLVKQYKAKETAEEADWLIGEGLFIEGAVDGVALRSMKAPGTAYDDPVLGKDTQPAHMKDYLRTLSDNGGVHTNSGIPNKAFYLAATRIGGPAWEAAGLVWYKTLQDPRLRRSAKFQGFAMLTTVVASTLFGASSRELEAIRSAWNDVGIAV